MSLLDEFAKFCTILEKKRFMRPEGGWITEWTDGEKFVTYTALDTSMEARTAEKQGVTSVYSILVERDVPIEYGDFFRDDSTGTTYRVTSNPEEKQAPKSSTMPLKYFTAERKEIPK